MWMGFQTEWFSNFTHVNTVHNKIKRFECNLCDIAFGQKVDLDTHMGSVHLSVKGFICDKCPKAYKVKRHLRMRFKRVHTNAIRSYPCNQCSTNCFTQGEVDTPVRNTHVAVRSSKCNQCQATFKTKAAINEHELRTNRDLKSLPCDYCWKTYRQKAELKYHLLNIHNMTLFGEKMNQLYSVACIVVVVFSGQI